MNQRSSVLIAALVSLSMSGAGADVQAGQRRGGLPAGPGPLAEDGVSPAEIQRLFDAYVVMQAQQELQLNDEQFPKFLTRVRALQDVRRRGQMQRGRMIQELRRLTQSNASDEQLRPQLKALADLDSRLSGEVKQALDGVDQVLDVHQQARFRIFEEQMERRKVDLLMRARQGNRARPQF